MKHLQRSGMLVDSNFTPIEKTKKRNSRSNSDLVNENSISDQHCETKD